MSLPEICLRRPVLAAVVNLLVIVIGLVAMGRLPVRELPDVDAATVTITTEYTGAAPEVVDAQITEVIESAVAGVAGVRTIDSSSERGDSRVRVDFVTGRNIDEAANDVRGAVGRVQNRLPQEADEPRIYKNDSDADPIIRIGIVSPRMSAQEITDYAERYIVDRLATLDGVASVNINGERRYAMRIQLDPKALAARELAVTDVTDALRANNVELPAGEVESTWRRFQLRADTRLRTADEFSNVVLRVVDGAPVRLGDVARVEIGVENDDTTVRSDGRTAVGLSVIRQSQANTIAISQAVRAEIATLSQSLPEGMELFVTSDDAVFIQASITEVVTTLAIAVGLVVLVIFLFLGSPRATVVPAVVIPVALIGAFIGMLALGYSINILTLFAMILAIGIVVDDAIVVLENIQRRIEEGQAPIAAAALGSREVGFAVIATSLTLISVFVPISLMEGNVGKLFTEFGMTMAIAVAFSTFVALTLTPVLCWKLLREGSGGALERGINAVFARVEAGYRAALRVALAYPLVVLGLAGGFAALSVVFYENSPRELTPQEDRGVFFVIATGPQGATNAYMDREAREIEAALVPFIESGEITTTFSLIGWRDPNRAFVVGRLSDWESGRRSAGEIVARLRPAMANVPGARAIPTMPAGLGLRGSRTPLQVKLLGPDFDSVREWADTLMTEMRSNPGLRDLEMDYEETQPELRVEIDRPLADDLGVSILDAGATLQTFFASREATRYLDRGREYPVILQAEEQARRTAADLAEVFVRSRTTGELIPLAALVRVAEGTASPEFNRFNRLPAIEISGALNEGYDMGAAIEAVREAAERSLPAEARIAFDGQSREYVESSSGAFTMLIFACVVVYLVLAAQFESFVDPLTILLSAPLAVTGALGAIWLTGQSINVYTQIGMLLLLGLMAKNGILIVEFANQLRDRGASVREAALEGAVRRLRPILMTVLSTLLGAAPLVLSTGAGSESRAAIGMVILGGFGVASLMTLFVTPVLFDLLARLTKPRAATAGELDAALKADAAAQVEPRGAA
ncbi:efflux RND transporter permease subunit [Rubrimonas cliftonensis]|uniref:Multidrug efflux pump n=1 Tax=Rubrimonas cliftonensis TaxID=89524 RepID=A0A1H4C5M1_9RHOB|nr:efflux RND transporter permease subunit [Rubrimonas cliftonensis]SEA55684.1 multidrug efflux pump [Rubrimonas cliftonensis]